VSIKGIVLAAVEREEVAMHPTAPATATFRAQGRVTKGHHKKASVRRFTNDPDGAEAFLHDFRSGFTRIRDGDAEAFGTVFVWAVTSNDAISELARDEVHGGEIDGFVVDLEDSNVLDPSESAEP
jgi:hypothetical protein